MGNEYALNCNTYLQHNSIDGSVFSNGYVIFLHSKDRFMIIYVLNLDLELTTSRVSFCRRSFMTTIQCEDENDIAALQFSVKYTVRLDGTLDREIIRTIVKEC